MPKYIKKVKLIDIQNWIGKPITRNVVSIGFDVASYDTGIVIMRTTDVSLILEQFHLIQVPKLPKNATTKQMLSNLNLFLSQLEAFKQEVSKKYTLNINRIEDCFFKFNPKTLKVLARYGILVYDRFKDISNDIDFITPTSSRSRINFKISRKGIKGKYLKKEILSYINGLFGTEITNDNLGDGCVLALGGLIK